MKREDHSEDKEEFGSDTRWEVVQVLEQNLADFMMPDVTWTGGISELKKKLAAAKSAAKDPRVFEIWARGIASTKTSGWDVLDPQRMSYIQDLRLAHALYEGLLRWDNSDFSIQPGAGVMVRLSDSIGLDLGGELLHPLLDLLA